MISLHALADGWNLFFHTPGPATTVGLFRVAFGAVLLVNAALLFGDLAFLYGPAGAVGDANRSRAFGSGLWSLPLPPSEGWLRATLVVHVAAAVLLTAGFSTRASAVVVFTTLLTLQSRNPLVTYGGDDVLRVMSFLLIFSPAGDALSIDGWLRHGSWRSLGASPVWCWRLMQLQVSILYAKAFFAKLAGTTWMDGRAIYLATEVEDFQRHRLPAWAWRRGWCRAGAWGTLVVEASLGPLVWITECRAAVVAAGISMHLVLEWFLNIYLFGAVMIACLTLFADPATIEQWLAAARIP